VLNEVKESVMTDAKKVQEVGDELRVIRGMMWNAKAGGNAMTTEGRHA
jgi:hypothetical protein